MIIITILWFTNIGTPKIFWDMLLFWHESFARNVKDLAERKEPNPLRGRLSEVHEESVNTTRNVPVSDLINRLKKHLKDLNTKIN